MVLACFWLGVSYPLVQPADFRCFPCKCDATSNATLRLLACELPDLLRYAELSLSDHNIAEIKPHSLPASLKVLSLSSNPLRNLNGALFSHLTSLQALARLCQFVATPSRAELNLWVRIGHRFDAGVMAAGAVC